MRIQLCVYRCKWWHVGRARVRQAQKRLPHLLKTATWACAAQGGRSVLDDAIEYVSNLNNRCSGAKGVDKSIMSPLEFANKDTGRCSYTCVGQ